MSRPAVFAFPPADAVPPAGLVSVVQEGTEYGLQFLTRAQGTDILGAVEPVDPVFDAEEQGPVFRAESGCEDDPDPAAAPVHPVFQNRDQQPAALGRHKAELKESAGTDGVAAERFPVQKLRRVF